MCELCTTSTRAAYNNTNKLTKTTGVKSSWNLPFTLLLNIITSRACFFTAPPGPLTGCEIRIPKDHDRHLSGTSKRHHHRRTPHFNNGVEDKDTATISCDLDNDGGVRPVTYSLEIYESSVLTSPFIGLATVETPDFINTTLLQWHD